MHEDTGPLKKREKRFLYLPNGMEVPIAIREAVSAIRKRDYLLPVIQRDFVWSAVVP
jgi:hypothetical protein